VGTYLDRNTDSIYLLEIGINLFKVLPLSLRYIFTSDSFKKNLKQRSIGLGAGYSEEDSESGIKIMISHPASFP